MALKRPILSIMEKRKSMKKESGGEELNINKLVGGNVPPQAERPF
jgi:hypothetical protein